MYTTGIPTPTSPAVRHGAVLVVTCLALATVTAAMSSLNVALPSIAADTHASQTNLSWIIDAYSLIFASLLLLGGAIGDRFGRRRALLIGLGIFGVASAAATLTTDAAMLIALRGVLGIGAALVMPATLSTITSTFPKERRADAVGTWAAVAGASAVAGLLSSGVLLELWSWRSIFWLNVALATVAIAGTLRYVPDTADPHAPALDLVGAVISVVGLAVLVYSIIEAPDRGWADMRTLVGIAVALVVLSGFIGWELHTVAPLLDPRLFTRRVFAAGTLSIFLQFFAFFGFVFLAMQYLQLVRGDRPLLAAVSVLPMAVGMMPAARLAPRVVHRVGARACCVSGLVLVTVGLLLLCRLDQASPYLLLAVGLIALGAGMGLAMTPATTAVTDSLPPALQGVGSAINDLSRELGGALGIAVLGSLLSSTYTKNLQLPGVPANVAEKAKSSFAVATHLGRPIAAQARTAFIDGIQIAILGAAAATTIAVIAVSLLLRGLDKSDAEPTANEPTTTGNHGHGCPAGLISGIVAVDAPLRRPLLFLH